ncbi:MAG: M20/M25/M40 family metallo-hydrolase [Candidatus Margulisiibacteriota bacterium]
MVKENNLKTQFLKLVKIDSPSNAEAAIMHYLAQWFRSRGWKPTFDDAGKKIGGEAGNLIVKIPGNVKNVPTILLNAHVDTVITGKGVKPRITRGVVFSDGTTALGADDKAGVAAILEVLHYLKTNHVPHGDILVVLSVAEEIGLKGAKALDIKKLKADFGYVLDGGKANVIYNQAPFQNNIEAHIFGRAAHAGTHPEKGISAIKVAAEAIAKMRLGRIDFETTANIGLIKGGTATNIVAELVEIKGEARSRNFVKLNRQTQSICRALSRACSLHGAKYQCKVNLAYRAFEIEPGETVFKVAEAAARKLKMKPVARPTGGGSDANIFNAAGIPCVILGLGARNLHSNREKIALKDLTKGGTLLLQIVKEVVNWTDFLKKR